MPKNELKKQVEDLKIEAEKIDKNNDFRVIHLDGIIQDVELRIIDEDEIDQEITVDLISNIKEAIKKYELEHPKTTRVLNRIMNTLSNMGI
jgi:hydrogenase maturation factor